MPFGVYDRQGKPLTMDEWVKRIETKPDLRRVAETTLSDGKWISTVWLGLDHNFEQTGPPLIFETMVFDSQGSWSELDCRRYATEAEALAGHAAIVAEWEAKAAGNSKDS